MDLNIILIHRVLSKQHMDN